MMFWLLLLQYDLNTSSTRISLPSQSPPAAGHIVEQQQLASCLENALSVGPRNVVLFLQDKVHTFYVLFTLQVYRI